jgi:hypothetical protein
LADCDWQVEAAAIVKGTTPGCQLTASRTVTRFNILGNGQGGSFEADGNDGSPLFVKPPGITMGPDDIPNSGISLNGRIYFLCNTGSDTSLANPQAGDYSVLVQFDEATQTFTGARTISPAGGRFIGTSVHASGTNVFILGAGPYRASDIYLQMVPASSFLSGAGTQYFSGLAERQPDRGQSLRRVFKRPEPLADDL